MQKTLDALKANGKTLKLKISGVADAPMALFAQELNEFLVEKGYATKALPDSEYSCSIRIEAGK